MKQSPYAEGIPDIAVEDALAAYNRMLERPSFIEWLPSVVNRYDDNRIYERRLKAAEKLRGRLLSALGVTALEPPVEPAP